MGFFHFLRGPDINQGAAECRATPGAVLLDVRTPREYREGHIPNSVNLPLQDLSGGRPVPAGKATPLFVYCHSGARSRQAVTLLEQMGYTRVNNIGGIAAYKGKVEF